MIIELQRAFTPEEMGECECGLAKPGRSFEVESVRADAAASPDARCEIGLACPACVAHFGQVNPERFPTIEVYRDALRRYPEPIWPDTDAAGRAEEDGTFDHEYNASWLWQSEVAEG